MNITELPPRQRQVAELVAQGKSTSEIAVLLGMTPSNVSMQKTMIKRKLGLATDVLRSALQQAPVVSKPAPREVVPLTDSSVKLREEERKRIQRETEAFLAKGGEVRGSAK